MTNVINVPQSARNPLRQPLFSVAALAMMVMIMVIMMMVMMAHTSSERSTSGSRFELAESNIPVRDDDDAVVEIDGEQDHLQQQQQQQQQQQRQRRKLLHAGHHNDDDEDDDDDDEGGREGYLENADETTTATTTATTATTTTTTTTTAKKTTTTSTMKSIATTTAVNATAVAANATANSSLTTSLLQPSLLLTSPERLLVLVIGGGSRPRYRANRVVWRMISHIVGPRLGVHIYFVAMDPNITTGGLYGEHSLLFPGEDKVAPGVLLATVQGLKYIMDHELPGSKAPYVVRTNLSSFWVFDKLLQWLMSKPATRFYAGVPYPAPRLGITYASGAGMTMSMDLARLMVQHNNTLLFLGYYDDTAIGQFMIKHENVTLLRTGRCNHYIRVQNFSMDLPPPGCENEFHYRVKSSNDASDSYSFLALFAHFYGPGQYLRESKTHH